MAKYRGPVCKLCRREERSYSSRVNVVLPQNALLNRVTGIDISPVQVERARTLVPAAELICEDMTSVSLPAGGFDAIVSLYAIIHVPLEEQPGLFRRMATWLKSDGWLLCTVGRRKWTGTEDDWLGVKGGTMFWSHTDARTYRLWLTDLGFRVVESVFLPEGHGGHTAFLAQKIADDGVGRFVAGAAEPPCQAPGGGRRSPRGSCK